MPCLVSSLRYIRFFALSLVLAVAACGSDHNSSPGTDADQPGSLLERVQASGELKILTRNAPTMYYVDRDGEAGPEHDLASAFANHLNVQPRFVVLHSVDDILEALESGEGHIAAAGLTRKERRTRKFPTGPTYQQVRQQVVCRRGEEKARAIDQLPGVSLAVPARSSYELRLKELKKSHPDLTWESLEDVDTEDLLDRVWKREYECTVADSNIVAINRRYHPELVVTFDLTEPEPLVWYFPEHADRLSEAAHTWFEQYKDRGQLSRVMERYYGFVEIFDYVDTRRFVRRLDKRLPKYRPLFQQAADKHDIDWTLLAAQSYQESHWRPRAKSPTGVRGLMMLTLPTAKQLGVKNRLDPKQSVMAGAKYLHQLRKRLPEEVSEPDRTWVALAAYNVGMGHIWDARRLARRQGHNPDTWKGLKTVLPLLSKKHYYKDLKYGYARGDEPVRYVSRIRDFQDMLVNYLKRAER